MQHSQEIANADNSEEKNAIKQKYEKTYQSEIDKLHQMQFEALPEDEKYSGTDSVEELLNKILDEKDKAVLCLEHMNNNMWKEDYHEYVEWKNNLHSYLKLIYSDMWYGEREK